MIDTDHISIVRGIESCLPNLKSGLEQALQQKAAVFFLSIVLRDEVYVIPIMAPVEIANRLATEVFELDRLGNEEMGKILKGIMLVQRLNSASPAPMEIQIRILGLYERLLWSSMTENEDVVKELGQLTPGDLVVMQVILIPEETAITTGIRIVKEPLRTFDLSSVDGEDNDTLFKGYRFPENMTRH